MYVLASITFVRTCADANLQRAALTTCANILRPLVNSQRSDQSDRDARIWFYEWASSKESLQAPRLFLPPAVGHARLASLADFLFRRARLHFGAGSQAKMTNTYLLLLLKFSRWNRRFKLYVLNYEYFQTHTHSCIFHVIYLIYSVRGQ